jgi:GA-binding protein transcription factor alpha
VRSLTEHSLDLLTPTAVFVIFFLADPYQWNQVHVRHWIQWAIREFSLTDVDINSFVMTGKELCGLSHDEFVKYIPFDRGDIFWTHLELLRKCKFVGEYI